MICTPLVAEIFVGAFVPVDSVGMLRLPGPWFLCARKFGPILGNQIVLCRNPCDLVRIQLIVTGENFLMSIFSVHD